MDLFESVPRHYKCPICYDLFGDKVFQCIEGHVLCELCFRNPQIKKCPQCKTPFGHLEIRNRFCEEAVELLRIDCFYSGAGCTKKLDRKSIGAHVENCHFRTTINFCKLIGYHDCGFIINRGNAAEAIQHLKSAHVRTYGCTEDSAISLESQNFTINVPSDAHENNNNVDENDRAFAVDAKLFILGPFLIMVIFDVKDQTISWLPFCFPSGNNGPVNVLNTKIEFTIVSKTADTSTEVVSSRVSPIEILKADKYLPFSGPFRFSVQQLTEYINKESNLVLKVKVKKFNDTNTNVAEAQDGQLDVADALVLEEDPLPPQRPSSAPLPITNSVFSFMDY